MNHFRKLFTSLRGSTYSGKVVFCSFLFVLALFSCSKKSLEVNPSQDLTYFEFDIVTTDLDPSVNESSGLMIWQNSLWTHMDSGGPPTLFSVDSTDGTIDYEAKMPELKNVDWEDVAHDSTHIFIADFGNNLGNRKDLTIYKVAKESLENDSMSLDYELIRFSYPQQSVFPGNYKHNFDAEALVAFKDSLYIFSKNWDNWRCYLYGLPKAAGTYHANRISEFDTKGLITGADYDETSGEVALIGYQFKPGGKFESFMWVLDSFTAPDFFSGNKKRYDFDLKRQTEAVAIESPKVYLFSAESENYGNASLYRFAQPKS